MTTMTGETQKLARDAISHVLNALCDDPKKFYLLGYGTGSYEKLTAAHAAIWGLTHEAVKTDFQPDKERYRKYCEQLKEDERLIEIGREHQT